MNKEQAFRIISDREISGTSYRTLGKKYGVSYSTVCRVIMSKQKKQDKQKEEEITASSVLPDNVKLLKEELRKAKLKIELQDLMIDIASKELGVDIRKKSGTRQSE